MTKAFIDISVIVERQCPPTAIRYPIAMKFCDTIFFFLIPRNLAMKTRYVVLSAVVTAVLYST